MKDKIFTKPFVRGVSVAVPKERVILKDLKFEKTNNEEIIKVTGIHEVRCASKDKMLTDYCICAAENLFKELNFDKSKIDGLVFSTPLGEYISPGNGYIMQDRMDLSEDCIIIDINQTCGGYVYGLFQAFMLIQNGYCQNVLVCAGDLSSLNKNSKDKAFKMIMGDAGAVALVSAGNFESESAFAFLNDGKIFRALYTPAGGRRMPFKAGVTDKEIIDKDGNVRTLQNTHMDGLEVMTFVMYAAPEVVDKVLKIIDWNIDDVNLLAFHQANRAIVDSVRKIIGLPKEKVPFCVKNYGNVSAATIPLTLCLENTPNRKNLEHVILCTFGSGMTCGAVALNLNETYFCTIHEL